MNVSPMNRLFLRVLLIYEAFTMVAAAQTADSTNEFWPEFDFYIKLNEKMRIYALYTATKPENLGNAAEGQSGVHIDFYAVPALRKHIVQYADQSRSKMLMVRAGYLVSRPKNNSGTATENMATGEATARAHLSAEFLLSSRNRVDLRWVNGDPKHRYRNRLKIERTYDIGRFQLTPYAHAEVFYDFKARDWTRFRYSAGAEWNITKRIVLEGYYLRQNTWASVPQFVNATGLAVQFYFR
jgi:hypothetical protein